MGCRVTAVGVEGETGGDGDAVSRRRPARRRRQAGDAVLRRGEGAGSSATATASSSIQIGGEGGEIFRGGASGEAVGGGGRG